ncbi:MAG TPA: enoyl-CoA hydratase/isomerase family protein [Rhodoglobus sp.]|nr:enoyl-CoA hydratase/isomerase family protein [Rhodoglobus sp.]
MEPTPDPVLVERRGSTGVLILNRPQTLNALDADMVARLSEVLEQWRDDDAIERVELRGAGERAFCAGGDVVAIWRDARAGGTASTEYWRAEYTLDAAIARYPKPVVSVMHGLTLGGGIGLGAHASTRVVTQSSRLGMPEVSIGFVPDVGGTWLLSRAPGELGTHLALTGGTVGPGDAIALGLADVYVPLDRLHPLEPAPPPQPELLPQRDWIDEAYAGDDVGAILARLEAGPGAAAAETIRSKSPTAVAVTLASLRRARELPSLEAALRQEYRVAVHALTWPDLQEGIRAQLIDKDRSPRWAPLDEHAVATAFDPVDPELELEQP